MTEIKTLFRFHYDARTNKTVVLLIIVDLSCAPLHAMHKMFEIAPDISSTSRNYIISWYDKIKRRKCHFSNIGIFFLKLCVCVHLSICKCVCLPECVPLLEDVHVERSTYLMECMHVQLCIAQRATYARVTVFEP